MATDPDYSQPLPPYGWQYDEKKDKVEQAPPLPAQDNYVELHQYISNGFFCGPSLPIQLVKRSGPHNHINLTLYRPGKGNDIYIEDAGKAFKPITFNAAVMWQRHKSDLPLPTFSQKALNRLATAILWAAEGNEIRTREDETRLLLHAYTAGAIGIYGHTVSSGSRADTFAALKELEDTRQDNFIPGTRRFKRDVNGVFIVDRYTSEVATRVVDLVQFARGYVGRPLSHGQLDAWLEEIGWRKPKPLQAFEHSHKRGGERGRHLSAVVYIGLLDDPEDDE